MKKILVCLFFLSALFPANAGELQTRDDITSLARKLFLEEKFDQLNKLGSSYLKNKSRTSSGLWKISFFSDNFGRVAGVEYSDPEYFSKIKAKLSKWASLDKDLGFAHLAYVRILLVEAGQIRGEDWARNVRPQDWRPYFEKLEEARLYMEKNDRFKNSNPNWYVAMLEIAKYQQWDTVDFHQMLDEALSVYPQYYPLYFAAIAYLQPRWGGSVEEIENFAAYATRRSKAVEGQGMYARIYWYASQLEFEEDLFEKSQVRWQQMKSGINDVLKKYPDQWNIQNFTYFSCLAKDKEMTRKLFGMHAEKPIMRAWKSRELFGRCRYWVTGRF